MRNKYKISLLIIVLLLLCSAGLAFLYFKYEKELNNVPENTGSVITTGSLSLNFTDNNILHTTTLEPGNSISKKFSISNAGEETVYYSLVLTNVINDFGDNEDIIFQVYDTNKNILLNESKMLIKEGKLVDYLELESGKTSNFEIIIKYQAETENQNSSKDKTISGTINVTTVPKKITTFREILLSNNEIQTESRTQVANDASSVEEGLIADVDADGSTYYFRGVVNNNYVEFSGYTWRIVRINGDNTIRLIMEDVVNNVGEVYLSTLITEEVSDSVEYTNFANSNLNLTLNNWYNSYLIDNDKYVSTGKFCFDNSTLTNEEEQVIQYTSYNRLMIDKNPTFNCLGTVIESKIGLLSADELIYAGAASNYQNRTFYLYNANYQNSWWTMTPFKLDKLNTISLYDVKITGNLLDGTLANVARSLRPVINIKADIEVNGNGTKDDPYKIIEKE